MRSDEQRDLDTATEADRWRDERRPYYPAPVQRPDTPAEQRELFGDPDEWRDGRRDGDTKRHFED